MRHNLMLRMPQNLYDKIKKRRNMELVKFENKNNITSLELVEQINLFRKQEEKQRATLQHKTMLEIIRDEFQEEIGQQKILPSYYTNSQNKQQPMYTLSFNQAKQLLVRESKAVRKAVIKYIEELENKLNEQYKVPSNFKEALLLAAKQQEEIEKLEQKIEDDRPKVILAQALQESKTSSLIGELAKLLKQNGIDIGANRLFEWLRVHGYLGTKGENYNIPTQKSMNLGIMEIKTTHSVNRNGSIRINRTPKITGKGQTYFVNKFLNKEEMR